jgi:hypothetical protein
MGSVETSSYLRQRLLENPRYRRMWCARLRGCSRPGVISVSAVCQVVAEYLWDAGEFADSEIGLPRRIRDRIRRTLAGQSTSPTSVTWICQAFHFTESDTSQVWELLSSPALGAGNDERGIDSAS